jgi:integrase
MAAVQFRKGSYRVIFRYHGRQETFTLGKVSQEEAEAKASQVDYLLLRLKQRLANVPPGVDIINYVMFDGKPPAAVIATESRKPITLEGLRERYLATHEGSLEATTLAGIRIHFKHWIGALGKLFPISELKLSDLQGYVDRRAKSKGLNGRKLSPATIKKEIVTLRTAWNWGVRMQLVAGRFPYDGLRYPRSTEKPPFQTRDEIDRQIAAGGLSNAEQADLWDALYLQVVEITTLLEHVRKADRPGFVYPMFCLAAHTGARRSELVRLRATDVDLKGRTLLISERKRVKGRATTRRVPLAPFLVGVLKDWVAQHPGGQWLLCQPEFVEHSKKRSRTTGHKGQKTRAKTTAARLVSVKKRDPTGILPLTPDEATDHFNRTLANSKWDVLRGWHCLRHSFISALANKGIDQRLIDEFVGHQSEEQRRRYRHLYPSVKEEAIAQVFG